MTHLITLLTVDEIIKSFIYGIYIWTGGYLYQNRTMAMLWAKNQCSSI